MKSRAPRLALEQPRHLHALSPSCMLELREACDLALNIQTKAALKAQLKVIRGQLSINKQIKTQKL